MPPILEARTSAIRNGATGSARRSQTSRVTGAMSSTVVTLSSSAEATAVITISMTITRKGLAFALFTDQMARYSNRPVFFSTPTIIIMPISRKMTFQSMPLCSEWKADVSSVAPMASIRPAPPRAAATRWIFSVMIRAYAPTKTTIAAQLCQSFIVLR